MRIVAYDLGPELKVPTYLILKDNHLEVYLGQKRRIARFLVHSDAESNSPAVCCVEEAETIKDELLIALHLDLPPCFPTSNDCSLDDSKYKKNGQFFSPLRLIDVECEAATSMVKLCTSNPKQDYEYATLSYR